MSSMQRGTIKFRDRPGIISYASAAGKKESEGPLGSKFHFTHTDDMIGEDSWEKAESHLLREAVDLCIEQSGKKAEDFQAIFSGDLLNQCIASTFGLRSAGIPFVGMYGACSTMALTLITASIFIQSGCMNRCIAATSSHFSSSERQYRNPLQYGGQRTPTAQWTVTGAGAVALSNYGDVKIASATIGTIEDLGITDANNMGAAMAPAAAATIERHLHASGASPEDYDLILTGDLGHVGSDLLYQLLDKEGISIKDRHNDAGLMIFDRDEQDVHAGGSGCGCSASVLCADILPRMESGELRRVLFAATGALLSPTSTMQGESIPGISHAVELVCE